MFRTLMAFVVAIGFAVTGGDAAAQPVLTVTGPPTASVNNTFQATVLLDLTEDSSGWSYGVCNDTAFTTHQVAALGATANAFDGGMGPAFLNISEGPEGYALGLVINLFGAEVLPTGTGYEISTSTLSADLETAATDIVICSTLGMPPVDSVIVINGASIVPTQNAYTLEINAAPPPELQFIAPDAPAVDYFAMDGIGGVSIDVDFAVAEANTAVPRPTQGIAMAVTNDSTLVTPTAVNAAGPLLALNGGMGPDFFSVDLFADSWSVGVAYVVGPGNETVEFSETGDAVVTVTYEGVAGALTGVENLTTSPLAFSSSVGTPPVVLVVVIDGNSFAPTLIDGSLNFNGVTAIPFERGEVNGDGVINVADVVSINLQLFQGAPIPCLFALDTNGDGTTDVADPIYLGNYLFQGGPPPPFPFMTCDIVPGQMLADCEMSSCAP